MCIYVNMKYTHTHTHMHRSSTISIDSMAHFMGTQPPSYASSLVEDLRNEVQRFEHFRKTGVVLKAGMSSAVGEEQGAKSQTQGKKLGDSPK